MASESYRPDFELHAFEGNPIITQEKFDAYPIGVQIHKCLAWTFDGETDFFINADQRVQGCSVLPEKITGNLDVANPIRVKCIDFSKWIRETFEPTDNIIIKSNIEGAEYDLFEKMLADDTARYISRLFLRRHWYKCNIPESRDKKLVAALENVIKFVKFDYSF
jgi:hypothetical protein